MLNYLNNEIDSFRENISDDMIHYEYNMLCFMLTSYSSTWYNQNLNP